MRIWICLAAVSGFVAVAMGAIGAHGLGEGAIAGAGDWIEIGARYQLAHAVALLAIGLLAGRGAVGSRWLRLAGWGFVLGTVLFSGGLYLMALPGWRGPGLAVPLGGLSFLAGWAGLFVYGLCVRPGAEAERAI